MPTVQITFCDSAHVYFGTVSANEKDSYEVARLVSRFDEVDLLLR